jgi:hypothetical protein
MTYTAVGVVQEPVVLALWALAQEMSWEETKDHRADYAVAWPKHRDLENIQGLMDLFPGWLDAFYVKLPPGGRMHKHVDKANAAGRDTYHIPVQTNDNCVCYMYEPDRVAYHLPMGTIYKVDRRIPHESVNGGMSDRIHFLVETQRAR